MKYFYTFLAIIVPIGGCSMVVDLWTDPLRIDNRVLVSLAVIIMTITAWADCCWKGIQASLRDCNRKKGEDGWKWIP